MIYPKDRKPTSIFRSVRRTKLAHSLAALRPDMELGHWVTGSMGHLGYLSRPGHRVIILTRCETRVFRFSKKCPKCKTYI